VGKMNIKGAAGYVCLRLMVVKLFATGAGGLSVT